MEQWVNDFRYVVVEHTMSFTLAMRSQCVAALRDLMQITMDIIWLCKPLYMGFIVTINATHVFHHIIVMVVN